MRLGPAARTAAALAAATALNLPFGTLYAFSVFLAPLEAQLGVGRAETSFVFALATITLTAGMNFAPALYRAAPPALLALGCGACSAAGLLLAANAASLAQFAAGYGVLFGLGAGVGFILVQQGVNQTVKARSGLANGYVVSLYPLGAMLGAPVFAWAVEAWGLRAMLAGLALTVLATCALAAALLRIAVIRMHDASAGAPAHDAQWPLFLRLAAVFFLAAAAGLMVLSQAAGIVRAYGGATALAVGATTFITGAIAAARVGGGWLVDRFAVPHVAAGAHLFALAGAVVLTLWPGPLLAVPALAMIGMGYGFVSGLTAAAIARYWHRNAFGGVAGRLYIAWCVAAVSLPVLAGWLYDRTGGYGTAVVIAAALNALGALVAAGLPAHGPRAP
jgi:MFS family permease